MDVIRPVYFRTPAEFRGWLTRQHATSRELWVGYRKKSTGRMSITWPESVDEALCFGWIDGVRRTIDDDSYAIRFTPRQPGSIWSTINVKRAEALIEQERMRPAGLKAYHLRTEEKVGMYSYEQRTAELPDRYRRLMMKHAIAWMFFQEQPPSYRKAISWWITSAKLEETRRRRLEKLILFSGRLMRVPALTPRKRRR